LRIKIIIHGVVARLFQLALSAIVLLKQQIFLMTSIASISLLYPFSAQQLHRPKIKNTSVMRLKHKKSSY
jgi:hypothetical protein